MTTIIMITVKSLKLFVSSLTTTSGKYNMMTVITVVISLLIL